MEKKLQEVLSNTHSNYILPFFWQKGGADDPIVDELERIYQSGVTSVCVESRVHNDFGGETWWRDMDIILEEAKKRGMTVWLLDDKSFPTGYANGLIQKKYPERAPWHVAERHMDVMGPQSGAFIVKEPHNDEKNQRELLAAIAFRRSKNGEQIIGNPIDLTQNIKGNFLYWDVPKGCYRIILIYKTREGTRLPGYISMIDEESVDVLIEAVYEPHYARYGHEFGKTFVGFFSDEPSFNNGLVESNGHHEDFYNLAIGTPYLAIPWRHDMADMLEAELGEDVFPLLPALWYDIGKKTAKVRLAYMNIVTKLYRDCFCRKLGDWCRERNVSYIGHIIEDMGCHTHMGCGAGHYFRSMDGQDMAGIDVVLQQIIPGSAHYKHTAVCLYNMVDPEFYDYILAKLAASLSNTQPRMQGRAMCEIYGAYGWAEGTPMMKWLTDHMLVRGINHFVPHAFVPVFPEYDCPPHFYARGKNPQYRDFGLLMRYANKMCHLFTDGHHIASAALLYHAEAEWSGGKFMPVEKPAKALYDRQLDYDILPCDTILEMACVENGLLVVNKMTFPALIVPYAELLPMAVLEKINEFAAIGLCVIFIQNYPKPIEGCEYKPHDNIHLCKNTKAAANLIIQKNFADITLKKPFELLRAYHYVRNNTHFVMLFNEDLRSYSGVVNVKSFTEGEALRLNILTDEYEKVHFSKGEVEVELAPYESCVYVFDCENSEIQKQPQTSIVNKIALDTFNISTVISTEYPNFEPYTVGKLHNITGPDALPRFSGIIKYETEFLAEGDNNYTLDMGRVGETAHIWVNDEYCGARICNPYVIDITKAVKHGNNKLVVEVANSLAYEELCGMSKGLLIQNSGLLGPVHILERCS